MGNKINEITFGGVTIVDAKKTDVRYDSKNQPIYCVWFENGAYAEYPAQKKKSVTSYYAKDLLTNVQFQIDEKTFNNGVTEKDGFEHEFSSFTAPNPSIFAEDSGHREDGKPIYDWAINGVDNLKFVGAPTRDDVYITNSNGADIVVDNNSGRDDVTVGVNCKSVKVHSEKVDEVVFFKGYKKGEGYFPNYK